jgi:hypothetical protein
VKKLGGRVYRGSSETVETGGSEKRCFLIAETRPKMLSERKECYKIKMKHEKRREIQLKNKILWH